MTTRANRVALAIGLGGAWVGLWGGPLVGSAVGAQPAEASEAERTEATLGSVELSQVRERAIEALVALARHERPEVRANAIEGLTPVAARVESVVRTGLVDPNPGVRSVAAMVVGEAKLGRAAQAARPMLSDEWPQAQASAIYALRRNGIEVDPSPLAGMLLGAEDARVRAQAAFVLGELGDESAAPMLREAIRQEMPRVGEVQKRLMRLQMAEALIKLGDDTPLSMVRASLYPARPEELEATALAVQVLGEVGDRGSIDQLIFLSAEQADRSRTMPAEVRLAVAQSLAKMGLREGTFLADELADSEIEAVRSQAASVYGVAGRREHLVGLDRLTRDDSAVVRTAAWAGVLLLVDREMGG
ncbi:MAG: HEAT repeat domain-containing protein [Planctomycetota bacterium]